METPVLNVLIGLLVSWLACLINNTSCLVKVSTRQEGNCMNMGCVFSWFNLKNTRSYLYSEKLSLWSITTRNLTTITSTFSLYIFRIQRKYSFKLNWGWLNYKKKVYNQRPLFNQFNFTLETIQLESVFTSKFYFRNLNQLLSVKQNVNPFLRL